MSEKSQYIIYIDAAERDNHEVALFKVNGGVKTKVANKTGKIDLVSSLAELLEESSLKLSDIAKFEANPGPGSFTGLKMSTTIVNVLNWVLGRKKLEELDTPNYGREPNISQPKKFKL